MRRLERYLLEGLNDSAEMDLQTIGNHCIMHPSFVFRDTAVSATFADEAAELHNYEF